MSYSLLIATAALVASVNAAQLESPNKCEADYVAFSSDPSHSTAERCEALVVFSKCLSQFDPSTEKEFLLFKQSNKTCEKYWKTLDTPVVRSSRDNLQMTVDDSKDIQFFRHRREAVSVFDMNKQLQRMEQTIKDLQAQLATQKTDLVANVSKSIEDLEATVAESIEDLEDKLDDKSDELDQKSVALETKLTKGVGDLSDKVDTSAAATAAALDKSKKDAATANTAFKTEMTATIDSKLKPFAGSEKALASLKTTRFANPKIPVFRMAWFHTYTGAQRWHAGNRANGFGGIRPSDWTDGSRRVDQMANDFKYLGRLFTRTRTASRFGANVCSEAYGQRSSTNGGVCGALFRIRNTGTKTIRWSPSITMTSYTGWGESASISINGNNLIGNKNCQHECQWTQSMDIPANSAGDRISTAIFIATGGYNNGHYNQWRSTVFQFGDNSLALPNGLEYVDDLDVATGAWKK